MAKQSTTMNPLAFIRKYDELFNRLLFLLGALVVYRFGSHVPIPGMNPDSLANFFKTNENTILGLFNMFSGGALERMSVMALGIMPYISASIIVQMMTAVVPSLEALKKEGQAGQRQINKYTRQLTLILALVQSVGMCTGLISQNLTLTTGLAFYIPAVTSLVAGSMFLMWLGEQITERGIGNGISMIIMIGIIARFPAAIIQEFISRSGDAGGGLIMFLGEIVVLLLVIAASILLVQGTRKVPVQYAKRVVGNKQYGGVRQYIPLKVNAAGVMPIIFAQAIMMVPIMLAGFNAEGVSNFMRVFMDNTSFWYNFVFAIMIVAFTYFYTAITINPTQMAEEMKRNNGFIPGVKPGKKTAEYIDMIMSRITLPGSFFLALVAIMPSFASIFGITGSFSQFYGGTSLLILVGVVLDTLQQVESHLLMRHYDGLLKSGRIKGRTGSIAAY